MAGSILSEGLMWVLRGYIVFYGAIGMLIALGLIAGLFRHWSSVVADELTARHPADRNGPGDRFFVR